MKRPNFGITAKIALAAVLLALLADSPAHAGKTHDAIYGAALHVIAAEKTDSKNAENPPPQPKDKQGLKSAPAAEEENKPTPPPELPKLPGQSGAISPDTLRLLEMIEKKNKELRRKEEELRIKEEQLKSLEQKLMDDLKKIDDAVAKSQEQLGMRKGLVEKNINSLVKVYSSMKPDEAATLITALEEDVAVQILSRMKFKTAGQVMSRMDKKVVKNISEKLAGLKASGLKPEEPKP